MGVSEGEGQAADMSGGAGAVGAAADETREAVRAQFGAVAANYVTSVVHATGDDLAELGRIFAGMPGARVLDLGTATGHAALAVAPYVGSVVGVDITPEMLDQAREQAATRGLDNVSFKQADVEQLPFVDRSFDAALTRFSAHHWPSIERALHQLVRVLRPGAPVIIIDTVGPADPDCDRFIDTVERLRDPSHVRDWTIAEWLQRLGAAGLGGEVLRTWDLELDFDAWVARMRTPAPAVARLNALLDGATPAQIAAFNVRRGDGKRSFTLPCAMFRGVAPA